MEKSVAILYGSTTGNTEEVAHRISRYFSNVVTLDVVYMHARDLEKYEHIIFGVPSWNLGQFGDAWYVFMPEFNRVEFEGKKIALFGLGDQMHFPEYFANALGYLYDMLDHKGARLIGQWSTEGYQFKESLAVRDGKFVGLVLDQNNQAALTESRIRQWVEQIKPEFN